MVLQKWDAPKNTVRAGQFLSKSAGPMLNKRAMLYVPWVPEPKRVPGYVKCTQKKISRAIGLLKYAKHYVQEDTLRNMYLSIVQPHFSYCCSVLGSCGATKLKTLQKFQNRDARIVTSSPFDTPAAPLLQLLRWPSIEKPINRETCTMVYKSLNELTPENQGTIFYKLSDVHARVFRDTKSNLSVPKMRTAYGQKSFAFRGAKAWNKLDSEMKLALSTQSFKMKLKALN